MQVEAEEAREELCSHPPEFLYNRSCTPAGAKPTRIPSGAQHPLKTVLSSQFSASREKLKS
jgi:hypothetical protein